ncbi:MAG: glycosyltransferase family 39 protein [Anaerolinea sp.]|nr:glycosyltransferase family 39 protein [Anaerolinea sp.]
MTTAVEQDIAHPWATSLITKYQWVLLAGITLLAFALRFYKLGEWSFWIDEIYTINRAQAHYSSLALTLRNIPPHTNWVPVSLLLISGVTNVLGISEWSVRLVPAIIGVLSIPILYFPIRSVFGSREALVAVLLLAVSPWHLTWSQNGRFYTALLLFYTLALLAFHIGLERDRSRYLLLGWLFFYLAMSERIFALFLAPVLAVYLMLLWLLPFAKPPGIHRRNLFILVLPVVVGLLIEAYSFITTGNSRFFGDFGWFFLYRNYTLIRLLGVIGFDIGFAFICLAVFGGFFLLIQKSRIGLLLFIGALLPLGILLLLSFFMFTQDRYLFVTLPSWIILAAMAIKAIEDNLRHNRTWLALAVLAMLVAEAAGAHLLYYRVNEGNRRDWRSAFTLVQEQAKDDDIVVAYWPEFGPYYLDRDIAAWEDTTIEMVVKSDYRTWFVVDSETVWGDLRKKQWIEQNAALIDVFYLRMPEDHHIRVYLYDPARAAQPDS